MGITLNNYLRVQGCITRYMFLFSNLPKKNFFNHDSHVRSSSQEISLQCQSSIEEFKEVRRTEEIINE